MTSLDFYLLTAVLIATLGLGLLAAKKETTGEDFLLAGRSLPWWAAGTSMVATTFAVDTPLVVAGLCASDGIAANWFWWGLLGSHLFVTFGLAARWRATRCTTDAEVVALRYGEGPTASLLRRLRALYFMVPINLFVLGWVLHAGAKVLGSLIPFHRWFSAELLAQLAWGSLDGAAILGLIASLLMALAYGTVAGLRGVVWTDLLQFSLAMGGALLLAWLALDLSGGAAGLAALIDARSAGLPQADLQLLLALGPLDGEVLVGISTGPAALDLLGGHGDLVISALLLSWWANKNADGGGVLVQRMLACRSRKDATLAMGWFTAAHYLIRPWAWMVVGLVVGVLFALPPASGFEQSYPDAMLSLIPTGLLGLALGGMVAALVSTADTHLHWGASYLANDLLPKSSTDAQRLKWARWSQPPMALAGAIIAAHLGSIAGAWKILLVLGAGLGAPTLLRWYLPRLAAGAELSAFASSTACAALLLWGPWPRPGFALQMGLVGGTGLLTCLFHSWRWPGDLERAKSFMTLSDAAPQRWWLWALGALILLLTSAAGAVSALSGNGSGVITFVAGLAGYTLLLSRFALAVDRKDAMVPQDAKAA